MWIDNIKEDLADKVSYLVIYPKLKTDYMTDMWRSFIQPRRRRLDQWRIARL